MTTPYVSVIVPVLDSVDGIVATLNALLRQTYPEDRFEVLIVDNGSTDGTRDAVAGVVEAHPERVKLLTELERRSSYAARNVGVAAARGEVLAFTDADCIPAADWIERGVSALDAESADYAAGRVEMTFTGPRPGVWEYYDAVGKLNQRRYMERGFGATANLFVRRRSMDDHGAFRADLISGGDYEFGRRLARAGEKGVYAESAVVGHPARASARSVLKKERRILTGRRQLEAMDALEHGRLTWRSFVPVRRCPPLRGRLPGLGGRLAFLAVANFVRYYTLALRLAGWGRGAVGRGGESHGR